jgi:flagellar motility protein MotE (MotC chaperone)
MSGGYEGMDKKGKGKDKKLLSLFNWLLLPMLFMLILTGVLLNLMGINVGAKINELAHSIPGFEKIGSVLVDTRKSEVETTNTPIKELALKQQLKKKQEELNSSASEVNSEKEQIKSYQQQLATNNNSDEERAKQIRQLAKLYTSMPGSNAAAIISQLSLEEGELVLSAMNVDDRAFIVSKMDPKRAAELTILMKDNKLSENADIAALQKRIQLLTKQIDELSKAKLPNKSY